MDDVSPEGEVASQHVATRQVHSSRNLSWEFTLRNDARVIECDRHESSTRDLKYHRRMITPGEFLEGSIPEQPGYGDIYPHSATRVFSGSRNESISTSRVRGQSVVC